MKTYILVGDICHPGRITVQAETLEEAVEKADEGDFVVYDEDGKNLAFTWNRDVVETEN